MRVAVEAAITLEEVVLHVAHHALGLAFGSGALGPAGPGGEAVIVRQFQEACVEDHAATTVMPDDGGFLVIHQNPFGHATKVPEGLNQGLVGVLRVLTGSGPDMKVAGVPEDIDREVDGAQATSHLRPDLAPVVLKLFAGNCLVSNGLFTGSQAALGLDVATNQGHAAVVTPFPQQLPNDFCVPDFLPQ